MPLPRPWPAPPPHSPPPPSTAPWLPETGAIMRSDTSALQSGHTPLPAVVRQKGWEHPLEPASGRGEGPDKPLEPKWLELKLLRRHTYTRTYIHRWPGRAYARPALEASEHPRTHNIAAYAEQCEGHRSVCALLRSKRRVSKLRRESGPQRRGWFLDLQSCATQKVVCDRERTMLGAAVVRPTSHPLCAGTRALASPAATHQKTRVPGDRFSE